MRFLFGVFVFFLSTAFFAGFGLTPGMAVVAGLGCGWYAGSD